VIPGEIKARMNIRAANCQRVSFFNVVSPVGMSVCFALKFLNGRPETQ
jgi:hypothetical protein